MAPKGLRIEGALTSLLYLQIQWIVYQVMCTLSATLEGVPGTASTLAAKGTLEKALSKAEWLSPKAKSIVAKTTILNTSSNKLGVRLGRKGLWEPSRRRPGSVASLV